MLRLSKRIRGDLKKHAVDDDDDDDQGLGQPPLQLVVREFAPLNPANEFRAFVFRRRLTALT